MSAPYLGNIDEDATIRFMWSSNDSLGASVTRATNGTISVYKDNNLVQTTAGVTDTEDMDGVTGVHRVDVDTSADAFYVTGSDYAVVLNGATIDGQTVNAVLAHFSIENRFDDVNVVSMAPGIITTSVFGAGAIDAAAVATDAGQEIADRVLARNIAGGSDAGRIVTDALRAMRNRVQISSTSFIVYEENDSTIAWHASKTTTGAHDFLTEINPT